MKRDNHKTLVSTGTVKSGIRASHLTFTEGITPLYVLSDTADIGALDDQLSARSAHLSALLSLTYGDEGGAFRRMSAEIQGSYMWACASLQAEIRQLIEIRQRLGGDDGQGNERGAQS